MRFPVYLGWMRELKFLEVSALKLPPETLPHGLSPIKEVYDIFLANAKLAINLGAMPGFYVLIAEKWILANVQAHHEITGGRVPFGQTQRNLVNDQIATLFGKAASTAGDELRGEMTERTKTFESFVRHGPEEVHAIVHGILVTIVIQAWTAFEVLVGDLVKKLQLSHPLLVPTPIKPKWSFTSRWAYRKAYEQAFKEQTIDDLLKMEEIGALALLRNLFVHANGYVDHRFMTKDEEGHEVNTLLQKWFPGATIGVEIQLDGESTREIIEPCFQQAYVLASSVEDWLKQRI